MAAPVPPGTAHDLAPLIDWLLHEGVTGSFDGESFAALCERMRAAGIALDRGHITLGAHHPVIGGRAFVWRSSGVSESSDFTRTPASTQTWQDSPFYYLIPLEASELRQRLDDPAPALNFPIFDDLRASGATDYIAMKSVFEPIQSWQTIDPENPPKGMLTSFVSHRAGGFSTADLDALRALLPVLALAVKSSTNRRMAEDISATYLGADAGQRVLSGDITRGSARNMPVVIWYFDLQGFTKLSETLPGPVIIEMLNDYFAETVDLVERHGGNVLKFMGDGMLAVFNLDDLPDARRAAVAAASELTALIDSVNARRGADGLPTTGFSLALHAGDVLYGNIGGTSRLDFTVIGPAVNTTSRVLGMCSALDQAIVISGQVANPLRDSHPALVSLGQYRLRGVKDRQELFTLDSGPA